MISWAFEATFRHFRWILDDFRPSLSLDVATQVVIRYAKGKPECTIELQVLSRCVQVADAAEHIPKVWGAAEQGRGDGISTSYKVET